MVVGMGIGTQVQNIDMCAGCTAAPHTCPQAASGPAACVNVCVCMYECTYVCVCVYTHTHTHAHTHTHIGAPRVSCECPSKCGYAAAVLVGVLEVLGFRVYRRCETW
jgi:hypothetical protein